MNSSKDSSGRPDLREPQYISDVRIVGLFGLYDYCIPKNGKPLDLSKLFIIYGDNGTGKTTILKLIYSAISSTKEVNIKSLLAQTPFRSLEISFNNGDSVKYIKNDGLLGSMTAQVQISDGVTAISLIANERNLFPLGEGSITGVDMLLNELSKLGLQCNFLADDRSFRSTIFRPDDLDDEALLLQSLRRAGPNRSRIAEIRDEMRALEIHLAMQRLERWFRDKTLRGSNIGEETANSMLIDVIEHISKHSEDDQKSIDIDALVARIDRLSIRTNSFATLGLRPKFPVDRIFGTIKQTKKRAQPALYNVLNPFLDGFEARLDALQEIHDIIDLFLSTINSYLYSKEFTYSVSDGFRIIVEGGNPIVAENLSSGEKQLVVLLCNSLITRDKNSIFLIDEPELSLNVKWQRQLLDSLLKLTGQTSNQFIVATHSLELLAGHHSEVVKLEPN